LAAAVLLGGATGVALFMIGREIARATHRWSLHRLGRQYERELRAVRRLNRRNRR